MTERPMYYDIDGNPLTLMEWANLFERCDESYRRVAQTQIGDVWISTVWLGLDHAPWTDGPPEIFESMIFPEQHYQERYATKEAALAGHDRAVAFVESGEYAEEIRQQEHEARREESERN